MIITINDYQRLMGLIEFASLKSEMPGTVATLIKILENARKLSQEAIPDNIVTMNSTIHMIDTQNQRNVDITITYPQDADSREGKISILSSVGIAVLGKQVGDIVSWKTPLGKGQFQISRIIYQPEAVGDYSL